MRQEDILFTFACLYYIAAADEGFKRLSALDQSLVVIDDIDASAITTAADSEQLLNNIVDPVLQAFPVASQAPAAVMQPTGTGTP